MYQVDANFEETEASYLKLERELLSLIEGEKNLIANLANLSSWIFHSYPRLNWCGFYLWSEEDQELVLGPFQGRPACIRIKSNKGVCGKAHALGKAMRVDDVDLFPGHIACDSASRSELVVPLMRNGKVFGVLDLDSPEKARFSTLAENQFTRILEKISKQLL
jgi:L-methionine (R)-S-oxide reductase